MSMATATESYATIMERFPAKREYLIPILQEIQEECGYVSRPGIYAVADYLRLPEAKVFGVATFYNQFRLTAPGKHQVQICRGTACHVKGSLNLLDALSAELGVQPGETTKDGLFSLDIVACLGACSIAPVMTINGEFHGRLDKKKIAAILKEYREKETAHA